MINLGLSAAEKRAYTTALTHSHSIRIRVQVLNLEHEVLAHLDEEILDGQVDVDAAAEVTRSASITFLDRKRTMDFDSDSPADGAVYADRLLRIIYAVKVLDIGDWVDVPIFTGVITKLDRAGDEVNLEAQGKETLALGAAWQPMTVKKGTPKVDAIRRIMRERGGENHFDLPDVGGKLPKSVSLGRESQPWVVASKIAESMDGRQLFFDGRGVCRLRHRPENAAYVFNQPGEILAPPQVAFSVDNVANAVWVKGGKPKAKRHPDETAAEFEKRQQKEKGVRHFETAPRSHPLSPWRLGRDDAPRYLLHVVDNDAIRSEKEAREVAHRILHRRLRQLLEVTFDSLVVPHLEEHDMVRVNADNIGALVALDSFSLPLKHDGVMSVGYLRRVSVKRRGPHRKHTRHHRHGKGGRVA